MYNARRNPRSLQYYSRVDVPSTVTPQWLREGDDLQERCVLGSKGVRPHPTNPPWLRPCNGKYDRIIPYKYHNGGRILQSAPYVARLCVLLSTPTCWLCTKSNNQSIMVPGMLSRPGCIHRALPYHPLA